MKNHNAKDIMVPSGGQTGYSPVRCTFVNIHSEQCHKHLGHDGEHDCPRGVVPSAAVPMS